MSDDVNPAEETEQVETNEPTATDEHVSHIDEKPVQSDDTVLAALMADDSDAQDAQKEQDSDTPEDNTPQEEQDVDDGDRDDLIKALRRDNVPMSVIEATDDDTLREWANKAQKRQTDVDSYGGRLKELEAKLETGDESAEDDAGDDGSEAGDGNNNPLAGVDIPEALADIVGDEAAQAIVGMIQNHNQQQTQSTQAAIEESRMMTQLMMLDQSIRPRYGDAAPDPDTLVAEMARLGETKPNSYESTQDMLEEAYRNLAGDPPAKKKRKTRQPTPTRSQPARPKSSPANEEDVALEVLMSGGSREDVERAMRT